MRLGFFLLALSVASASNFVDYKKCEHEYHDFVKLCVLVGHEYDNNSMPLCYLSAQYGININVRLFQKYLVVTENKNLSSMTASERLALSVVKPTNITIRKNLPESAIPPPLPTDCYATKNRIDKKLKERIDINKDVPKYLSVDRSR